MTIAKRTHPFPSRTRKLSSSALMILGGRPPGKVGRRRIKGCSEVAQWWSNRLLTGRSWVRAPPSEPYIAEVAELADAQDLKSCEPQIRTGSSPVFGITYKVFVFKYHRGIEQLVARRAHNPEVVGSNPAPATKKKRKLTNIVSEYSTVAKSIKIWVN